MVQQKITDFAQDRIIKGLWIGNKLSPIEILCINSYLHNGHEFHLYTYEPIKNIPEGATIIDAGQIIPHAEMREIISKIKKHAFAIFSDIFRYKLLYELGGWWSDLDAICIKYYDIDQEYVFMDEKIKGRRDRVCSGVIKTPAFAPIMDACFQKAMNMISDLDIIEWYTLGPVLLAQAVTEFELTVYSQPSALFAPIGNFEVDKWLRPYDIGQDVYSIHIYNDVWSTRGISKYGIYSKASLLEKLKQEYSVKNDVSGFIKELSADFRKEDGFKAAKSKIWFIVQSYKSFWWFKLMSV